jgi:CheY-like chemotaxis protein
MLSAQSQEGDRVKGLDLGAKGYVSKLFFSSDQACLGLPSSVRRTITIWRPASMLTRKPRSRRLFRRTLLAHREALGRSQRLGHLIASSWLQSVAEYLRRFASALRPGHGFLR